MNYKYLFFFLIFLFSCEHHNSKIIYQKETKDIKDVEKVKKSQKSIKIKDDKIPKLKIYFNKGFALIYDEKLFKKKILDKEISSNSIIIYNQNLEKNTPVKITNLINGKNLITKIDNEINYPFFYNSVISQRIVNELSIDFNEPYVQIETLNSKTFYVADESKTFEEEKNVANKAPVDTITIQNIGNKKPLKTVESKKKIKKFNYIIKFADLYFEDSAIMLKERLENEFNIKDISIKKLSSKSFRVYKGPYMNLKSLKDAYSGIDIINFENVEIVKL